MTTEPTGVPRAAASAATTPSVGVVVLTWNCEDTIERCLSSVLASTSPVAITVVDNASADGTLEVVRSRFPEVEVIQTGANLGYAGGNNVALRNAKVRRHDRVLLLNPDAYIAPDLIEVLSGWLDENPQVAGASPLIQYSDSDVIWYAGSDIDWRDGATFQHGQGLPRTGMELRATPTERLNGCAMMLRSSAVEQVGGLDEAYFLYYEETDLSVRLTAAGWALSFVPNAVCWHAASSSTGGPTGRVYHYYMTRGRLRLLSRHAAGRVVWWRVALLMAQELRWIRRQHGAGATLDVARSKARGVVDFLRGRTGRTAISK